ncbi:MAG: hydroxymethylglutaryl-CoA reductase, degradative [Capnocytophaga sp.]|nr:hydroxymethylglutaryl-CoA reductase, degradative [Capnocytophaga sp.]
MIQGFSKLTKIQKRDFIVKNLLNNNNKTLLEDYDLQNTTLQDLHDEFIENTIANYVFPLGVAPNFLINNIFHCVPMAIEESSVVAGASKVAKFWAERGGFTTKVTAIEKTGQVHFFFDGNLTDLQLFFNKIKPLLLEDTQSITENMQKRGGGILGVELKNKTAELENYYQLHATFDTRDAMGANFINSCLEQFAKTLEREASIYFKENNLNVLMSILSNYVPNCIVKSEVSCHVDQLNYDKTDGREFAENFVKAIQVANTDIYRAVTHNKGIMNGIDAVVIATGNDFRAIEACCHAYAGKSGKYQSLSYAYIENDIFHFGIEIPLAVGTVGGLTKLHPMVKTALEILQNPSAEELMQIIASVGLAQNFAAVGSLITSGIQKGHMKMHLTNILNQLGANNEQKAFIIQYFKDKTISHKEVVQLFEQINKK